MSQNLVNSRVCGKLPHMLTETYRDLLKTELVNRTKTNPRYSLRAFARDLSIEPGQLSRVLNGKKNISQSVASYIANKMFDDVRKQEYFVTLVELATAKREDIKKNALNKLMDIGSTESLGASPAMRLELETFKAMSDWYHSAILCLTSLKEFQPQPSWIARYLGISEIEAKTAVQRLLDLGLLVVEAGTLKQTSKKLATSNGVPSEVIRNYHKQMIGKALESVEGQKIEQRYLRGKTIAVSKEDLPRYQKAVENFMQEISGIVAKTETTDAIYQVNLQLFELKKQEP